MHCKRGPRRKTIQWDQASGALGLLFSLTLWGQDCLVFVFNEVTAWKEWETKFLSFFLT